MMTRGAKRAATSDPAAPDVRSRPFLPRLNRVSPRRCVLFVCLGAPSVVKRCGSCILAGVEKLILFISFRLRVLIQSG